MKSGLELILKVVGFLLILLISSQIIVLQEGTVNFPFVSRTPDILSSPAGYFYPVSQEVNRTIVLKVMQGCPEYVKVIVDGKVAAEFKEMKARLDLQPGEKVWLDGREAVDPVWVRIIESRWNELPFIKGREYRIQGELKFIGEIPPEGRL